MAVASGALTISGLQYSADMVGRMAAASPVKTTNLRAGYVNRLTDAKARDLDIARSVPVAPVAATPTSTDVSPGPGFSHKVAVEALRVRSGPRRTAPQVFTLKGGSWVNIGDQVRGWVLITDEAGKTGWVYGSFLRSVDATEAQVR